MQECVNCLKCMYCLKALLCSTSFPFHDIKITDTIHIL